MRRCLPLLVLLVLLLGAPAAQAELLDDIQAMRAQVGLPALTPRTDPLVGQYLSLTSLGDSNGPDALSSITGGGCGCWLGGKSIRQRYQEGGGGDDVLFWQITHPLARTPALWQLVLDPRATAIWIVTPRYGSGYLAVWFDRSRSWTQPLVIHPQVDLASTRPPAVLLPPAADGRFVLEERVGGRWHKVPARLAFRDGLDGAGLVLPGQGDETDLAAGRRYRVRAAGQVAELRTQPIANPSGTWKFDASMTPLARRRFLRAIAESRPAAQQMLRRVAGEVLVRANRTADTSVAGWLTGEERQRTGRNYYVDFLLDQMTERRDGEVWRLVTLHELGHTLDFAGISEQAMQRFRRSFSQARGWREEYAAQWLPEIFASQFALYAAHRRFYHAFQLYPVLISDRAFSRQLRQEWARAPMPGWFNQLQGG